MTKEEIRGMQRTLNAFTSNYLKGVKPLMVDGVRGYATNRRILTAKYYLGYSKYVKSKDHPEGRDATWKPLTVRRLRHPRSREYLSAGMISTGIARRRRQKLRATTEDWRAYWTPGVTYYDGKPVAKWMVPYLQYARSHGWQGHVNSGWRSPAYSESLCYQMCGAPTCAGKCAGRSSNHAGSNPPPYRPSGALDVSDYTRFGYLMKQYPHTPRIYNALGSRDPVHFSVTGN